jgi:hypothetical protein
MEINSLSASELIELRNLLYDQDVDRNNLNSQKLIGIYLVDTYDRRTPLPHAILSTAHLLSALISPSFSSSPYDALFIYASAFARFVTGFCDTSTPDSGEKRSMYDVAQAIGMPEEWVEMRHEITHGRMPPLGEIKVFAEDGMRWLWREFWVKLDLSGRQDIVQPEVVRDWTKSLLRIRREKLRELSRGQEVVGGEEAGRIVADLVQAVKQNGEMVVDVLVGSRVLFPKKEATKETMGAAFLIWDGVMMRMCKEHGEFLTQLLKGLQQAMLAPIKGESKYDTVKQAEFAWLNRLLTSSKWAACRPLTPSWNDILSELAEECTLWPGYWSNEMEAILLRAGDDKFNGDWKNLLSSTVDSSGTVRQLEDDGMEVDDDHEPKDESIQIGGWKLHEGPWTPRPIGA